MKLVVEFQGRLKYLLIGLAFLLIPVYPLMKLIEVGEYRFLPILVGFMLMGPISLWAWFDMRKHDLNPQGSRVPQKYALLFAGYVFTFVGCLFAYLQLTGIIEIPPSDELSGPAAVAIDNLFLLLGAIFALIGLPMLLGYISNRLSPKSAEAVNANDERLSLIIGGATGGLTLVGVIVAGVALKLWYVTALGVGISMFLGVIGWVKWQNR